MTVAITRLDLSAAELREMATRTEDAKAARRMLAIALVWKAGRGKTPRRRWIGKRCAIGCIDTMRRGRMVCLTSHAAEQQAKVAEWVEQGPELERDGVVRGRCTAYSGASRPGIPI